jgi:hypothetical protein
MLTNGKRHYFECENGCRWSECSYDNWEMQSKDGGICCHTGCLPDHTIKLVKTTEVNDPDALTWSKGWDKWEDSPVYKSLQQI